MSARSTSRRGRRRALSGLLAATLGLCGAEARAGTDCSSINGNPVVYVTGTAENYVSALARALFVDTTPLTVIWVGNSSCDSLGAILDGTPLTGSATYWDPSSSASNGEETCTLPALEGGSVVADIGVTDVFASTCTPLPNGLPSDVGDFLGPVQTMAFVVPKASTERSISATAAYFVYGFGGASGVAPWTNATNILRMSDASGTQRIIGTGINVPAAKWKGTNVGYSSVMISDITAASTGSAPSTIGVLATSNITSTLATQMNVLAYKHYGQSCAYYPDSSASSHDKRNVRDGHYALWGPVHIFSKLNSGGYPINSNAKRIINYLTGATPPPGGLDMIQVAATSNLIPSCAMKVKRDNEMGPLTSVTPANPCGCDFEYEATGTTACTPCGGPSDCPPSAPVCSFGYCEPQ
jgi:hypothetical protein